MRRGVLTDRGREMRRRQITVGAVAGLAGGCLVAGALAAGSPRPYPTSAHPPQPILITLGVTRSATLVSWCWSHRIKTGGTVGVCADGSLARPPHRAAMATARPCTTRPPSAGASCGGRHLRAVAGSAPDADASPLAPGGSIRPPLGVLCPDCYQARQRPEHLSVSAHGDLFADIGLRKAKPGSASG